MQLFMLANCTLKRENLPILQSLNSLLLNIVGLVHLRQ
uniref:Uncharacterized protein n=1 Tax=Anguilla anguilla TaxID=7936 RepID=A0A0E9UZB1_ANGAN